MAGWREKLPFRAKEKLARVEEETNKEQKLYSQAGLTQEAFIRAVRETAKEEKRSFLPAVYQTFDRFLARELEITRIALACKKGCSVCCSKTLLACTEPEIDAIIRFLNGLPRLSQIPLLRRVRRYVGEWKDYYQQNQFSLETNPWQAFKDWQKPCVFLNEEGGYCDIYPVRIMDCRNYSSLTLCTSEMATLIPCELHHPGPGRFRFQAEQWANNLILEEEAKRLGLAGPQQVQVVIIYHWLLLKKKEWK